MRLDDWFLRPAERGNAATRIDRNRPADVAWTEGNKVEILVHGAIYFARLAAVVSDLRPGDEIRFTDWRGDGDECVADGGPAIATLLAAACRRGVDVRGLLWRSHSDRLSFSKKQNRRLADEVSRAGGEVLLDERVKRGGSHHQKLVVVRHPSSPDRDVAFVGGIDLSHGRRDDVRHEGDRQVIRLDRRYGSRPPWHDAQLEVRGPAVADLDFAFRERWEDPTPLNYSGGCRAWLSGKVSRDRVGSRLPAALASPPDAGGHAVQVLRTYPARRPPYPFAPRGERSIARAFSKAIDRARTLVYIEDQYFWSAEIAELLAEALDRQRELQLIVVVPRYPDKDGRLSGPPARMAQERAVATIRSVGGERVGVYDIENKAGTPVYVHAKICVIDDVWAAVGSDNLNRRSWTHDSELACAVIDSELDERAPLDPGGLGDRSRRFARELRLALWAEHLGRSPGDPRLLELSGGRKLWEETARELADWEAQHVEGGRPPGQVRPHEIGAVPARWRPWARLAYRSIFDPDGRPYRLRATGGF